MMRRRATRRFKVLRPAPRGFDACLLSVAFSGSLVATCLTPYRAAGLPPSGEAGQATSDADSAAQGLILKARAAEQKRDYQAAAEFYQQYLKARPDNAEVLQRLGLVEYLSNRFERAIPPLAGALRLDPSLWGSALYLGISYYRTDHFRDAALILRRALELRPHVAETEFWLGCSLLAENQPGSAISHLLQARADPGWGLQAEGMLVKAYRHAAEDSYQRIAAIAPDSQLVHLAKAQLLEWKGINNGAVWEARRALQRDPKLEGAHRIIGDAYWQEKGFELAAKEFQAELMNDPLDGISNLRLGEFWLAKGEAQKAAPCLRIALQQGAGLPGEMYHFLGEADLALRDYAKAISDLQHAVRDNPSDPANHRLLAEAYRASGRADLAAQEEQLSHASGASSPRDTQP
jgi:tetratricopeptide (TPR) repeat protein